ncbi:ankyrin repeat-containing protein BDA1-like [Cornus florida]|uniref:ankyrin repeat-containing protein BDA1-like n=1 Tax=Cornus florida TaxID=4283 RepID=UPI0028A1A2E9|nr:ankyrin repeat-containing protein BDA1-like [Cornus florida]
MNPRLKVVADTGDVNALYRLFRESPEILDNMDNIDKKISMVDTPLHVAAWAGHTHFAVEMISLKPSFGQKLNPDGLSPLHLALQNGHYETVLRLININSNLIRVQGKDRITPLHYVAEKNQIRLLAEFLCACPESVQDLTNRGETAVHIAVRSQNFEAFKVLYGWIDKTDNEAVLQWKDEDGNTALHIAAYTNQSQVVKMLLKQVKIIGDKNMQGSTALALTSNVEIKKMLAGASSAFTRAWSPNSTSEKDLADFVTTKKDSDFFNMKKMSDDLRNTVLVVATLVATATYQVAVNPPSGIFKEINGKESLDVPTFFYYCLLFINSTAFATSVGIIVLTLQIRLQFLLLRLCLLFLVLSYIISVLFTTPNTLGAYITVPLPFLSYLLGTYFFFREVYIFIRMPIGRYNPARYFQMRYKMVGWEAIQ